MNKAEAQYILDIIRMEYASAYPSLRQIGNGEWTVMIGDYYIWRLEDWYNYHGRKYVGEA